MPGGKARRLRVVSMACNNQMDQWDTNGSVRQGRGR